MRKMTKEEVHRGEKTIMHGRTFQLFLINTLTCGLEICMATGTIYIPPMLLEAGVEERFMTMVLGVGPVLGLIFVPLIGSASDGWNGRFGRRRPFIWALGVGVLAGLLVIPHTSHLAGLLSKFYPHWLEVPLLVSAICLFQFCGQACFTPLEALVSDLYPAEEESRRAFAVFTLMLSLGACIGYLLPSVDWSTKATVSRLGGQEAFIYALLTFIFLTCLLSTAYISEERALDGDSGGGLVSRKRSTNLRNCCSSFSQLFRLQLLHWVLVHYLSMLPQLYRKCFHIPPVIRKLFVSELFSWMALMTFELFYTDFVGEALYHGVPSAEPGSPERLRYDEGVRMASMGLFLQCVISVVISSLMENLIKKMGTRALYLSSMAQLALSTAVMTVTHSTTMVIIMTAATGYTFCVLQMLPYTLTCLYHSDKEMFFSDANLKPSPGTHNEFTYQSSVKTVAPLREKSNGHNVGISGGASSTPVTASNPSHSLNVSSSSDSDAVHNVSSRGMCLDIAILDTAYLLSQVLPSLLMGSIVHIFHSVTAYMACAFVLSLLAIFFSRKVVFDKADMKKYVV